MFVFIFCILSNRLPYMQAQNSPPSEGLGEASKPHRFQIQPHRFFQSKNQVHILNGLSGGAFQQIIGYRKDHEFIAMFFEVNNRFVGVYHLFKIRIRQAHKYKWM